MQVDEGLQYSVDAEKYAVGGPLKARCLLFQAVGHGLNMLCSRLQHERDEYQEKALTALQRFPFFVSARLISGSFFLNLVLGVKS